FFFQAEDGIRDRNVTGVQTCALPIYLLQDLACNLFLARIESDLAKLRKAILQREGGKIGYGFPVHFHGAAFRPQAGPSAFRTIRSEERRVGKECRTRWAGDR